MSARRTALLWVLVTLIAGLAAYRMQPLLADSRDAPATGIGTDYRATVYGPNILVSEHSNPWDPDASVPRFGSFPAPPIWPVSYIAYPLLDRVDYTTGLTLFMCCSILLVAIGCARIARSLGLSRQRALLVASLIALSPTHLYDLALGQTGAGLVAAVAFFAIRARQQPSWWHHVEKWTYGATILFLFAKPTFALTFLAANLAYERSARIFVRFLAAAVAVGLANFIAIVVRSGAGLGTILRSMRETSTILSEVPVNRMDGDRLDLLSLIHPSALLDLIALVAVAGGLVLLHRMWQTSRSDLRERLVMGIGLVTIGTYHHTYDSLPLLALLCITVLVWPMRRAIPLTIGLVVPGWLYGFNAVRTAITDVVAIDFFALSARIIFHVVVAVLVVTYLDTRRQNADSITVT
ncbi:MAG: glycosyltransferase 87 family protein [Actinomycetia bacterium]|nr:glycosyltransferase 87 family protein [Actinomycetes bacterium]